MMELTTSVMILFGALYGGGQASAETSINGLASNQINPTNQEEKVIIEAHEPLTLEEYVRKLFADKPILAEIAKCESQFTHFDKKGNVIRGKVNPKDVGVMQINEDYHDETAKKLGLDIRTIEGNLAYATWLFEKYGSKPWVHSSKCWKKHEKAGELAVK
jgi:hypothetical protein